MHPRFLPSLLGLAGVCLAASPALAEPLRVALVIGNAHYASLPELGQCAASATLVRDALKERGFEVIERPDLNRGEFDAAIGTLTRRTSASPPAVAALYYCGYAVEFNARTFLLPVSTTIARDSDVLTQGIIAKSLVDSLAHVVDSAGFVLLDSFQTPDAATNGLARLAEQVQPGRFAVIGTANAAGGSGPTAAALALRDAVKGDKVTLEAFLNGMRDRLAKATNVAAALVAAVGPAAYLAGAPAPPPPPPPPPVAATAPPPAQPPAQPIAAAPPPPPPPPVHQMSDEDRMSDLDRRQVQAALATMGYYSGRIDATFGPETRAAIRRFQFEIKAEQTGVLTAEQATKLVNSVR